MNERVEERERKVEERDSQSFVEYVELKNKVSAQSHLVPKFLLCPLNIKHNPIYKRILVCTHIMETTWKTKD